MSNTCRVPSSIIIGSKRIRFLAIDTSTDGVSFPETMKVATESGLRVLFFACDVLTGTAVTSSNTIRIHKRMSVLGYATRLQLQGFRIADISNGGIMWFYDVKGVFRALFEFGTPEMQRDCLLRLTKVWLAQYDFPELKPVGNLVLHMGTPGTECESPRVQTLHQPVEYATFCLQPSQADTSLGTRPELYTDHLVPTLCTRRNVDDLSHRQSVKITCHKNLLDLNDSVTCSETNPSINKQKPDKNATNTRDNSEHSSEMSDKHCVNIHEYQCHDQDIPSDVTQTDGGQGTGRKFVFSQQLLEAAEAEYEQEHSSMKLQSEHEVCEPSLETPEIDGTCVTESVVASIENTNAKRLRTISPNYDQNDTKSDQSNIEADCDFLPRKQSSLKEQICALIIEYISDQTAMENKCASSEQRSEVVDCISITLKYLTFYLSSVSDDKNTLCKYVFRVMEDFLIRMDVGLLETVQNDVFGTSKTQFAFLQILSDWLGREFYQMRGAIEEKVKDFKIKNLYNMDSLPSHEALMEMLFPECMIVFIKSWLGSCSSSDVCAALDDHSYLCCEEDDARHGMKLRLTQLILELSTNCLISGTAHVVYSQLRIQK